MLDFWTKGSQARRTLIFASSTHVWSDLFFALPIPLLPFMKEDLGLSFTQVGLFRSVFSGSSAVLQVPAGFLAETLGEFWLLIGGNIWVAAGLVGMAFAPTFVALLGIGFVGGLGGGTQHPLASSMVSRAYDDRGRSTAVGTVNFTGDLGKMAAPLVAGAIAIAFGWRTALLTIGLAGILFMVLSVTARRAVDIGKPGKQQPRLRDAAGIPAQATQKGGFVALSGVGFLDSSTRGAALVFLPFVMTDKGMGGGQVSVMLFLLFTGGAAGKFVCGWLGDRFGSVSLIWGTKGLTAALLVLSLVAPPLWMAPLMVALGVGLNGTSSVLYATVAEFVPAERRSRLYGLFYTTNEGGTVLSPLVCGLIADAFGLRVTIVSVGLMAMAILPASLTLRRHLAAKVVVRSGAGE